MEITVKETSQQDEMIMVSFEISKALRRKIKELAFKRDISFSAMSRYILEMYCLDQEEKENYTKDEHC